MPLRGLTIARGMPEREFLFVGGVDAPEACQPEFRGERIPNLGTVFKNFRSISGPQSRARFRFSFSGKARCPCSGVSIGGFKPDICVLRS